MTYYKFKNPFALSGREVLQNHFHNYLVTPVQILQSNSYPDFDIYNAKEGVIIINARDLNSSSLSSYFHVMNILSFANVNEKHSKYLKVYNVVELFSFLLAVLSVSLILVSFLLNIYLLLFIGIGLTLFNLICILIDLGFQLPRMHILEKDFRREIKDVRVLDILYKMQDRYMLLRILRPLLGVCKIFGPLQPISQRKANKEERNNGQ
jgi:hypothetical protein